MNREWVAKLVRDKIRDQLAEVSLQAEAQAASQVSAQSEDLAWIQVRNAGWARIIRLVAEQVQDASA